MTEIRYSDARFRVQSEETRGSAGALPSGNFDALARYEIRDGTRCKIKLQFAVEWKPQIISMMAN